MPFVPLPFPKCPSCGEKWSSSVHRGCGGDLEVEPWEERVKCRDCERHWHIDDSRFYCTCGHIFDADDVDDAVDEVVRATRQLVIQLRQHERDLAAIRRRSEASFHAWLADLAASVGGAAGFVIGRLIRMIVRR